MNISKTDLAIIVAEGEGQKIEFKESLSSSLAREFVAFSNASGGIILLGVADSGAIKGFTITNDLKSRIMDMAHNCDPAISVSLKALGNVLAIAIDGGPNKPYQCKDGFFLRQGANSQKLSRNEILQLSIEESAIRFDSQINRNFRYPRDFDKEKLKRYLHLIGFNVQSKNEDVLVNLGVAQKIRNTILFNNAGILLFAKDPTRFFASAYMDTVVFKGTERIDVIDRKVLKGGLIDNINDARKYLQSHLNLRYEYKANWRRENIYELPLDALREAVANALIHRDYFISGANISLCIFDDRVEISSPGGLPKPLQLKDLGKKSKRRNEIIADIFSRLDFVEKLGTGINKMKRWMKEYGLVPPKIDINGFFTISFNRTKSVKNVGKKSVKNVGKEKRQLLILEIIAHNSSSTLRTIADELGVTEKTIERDIRQLKNKSKLRYVGPKRGGRYEI